MENALAEHRVRMVPEDRRLYHLQMAEIKWGRGRDGVISAAQPKPITPADDLREQILSVCTPLEREIVRLREAGHTYKEIGVLVDRTDTVVSDHFREDHKEVC